MGRGGNKKMNFNTHNIDMNLPIELQAIIFNKADFKTKLLLRGTCKSFANTELVVPYNCTPMCTEDISKRHWSIKINNAEQYHNLKLLLRLLFDEKMNYLINVVIQ